LLEFAVLSSVVVSPGMRLHHALSLFEVVAAVWRIGALEVEIPAAQAG
jgi:hypothetical protein